MGLELSEVRGEHKDLWVAMMVVKGRKFFLFPQSENLEQKEKNDQGQIWTLLQMDKIRF